MSDFYRTPMGIRFFNNDIPKIVKALDKIAEWAIESNNEKEEHYRKILNNVVGQMNTVQDSQATVGQLLVLGFYPDELVEDFGFNKEDVEYCVLKLEEDDFK